MPIQNNSAKKILMLARQQLHPGAILLGIENMDPSDRCDTISIGVPIPDYAAVIQKLHESDMWAMINSKYGLNLRIKHVPPKLVPAKIKDFVIPYSESSASEEKMGTGIVTAKYVTGNKTCYGCRYIIPNIGMRSGEALNFCKAVFRLTDDNYGGHPIGFYKIISQEEAIRRLRARLERDVEEAMGHVKDGINDIDKAIAYLLRAKATTRVETIEIPSPY